MDDKAQLGWYLWAKSDRDYKDGRWLPLLTHLLDVAASAWEILRLEPRSTLQAFADAFQMDIQETRKLVCALVGLHDLGKAAPTFQCQWDLVKEGNVSPQLTRLLADQVEKIGHGQVSHALLNKYLQQKWGPTLAYRLGEAVGGHHGRRFDNAHCQSALVGEGDWSQAQKWLLSMVFRAVGLKAKPGVTDLTPQAAICLAGLTTMADWIGSSFEIPYHIDEEPLRNPKRYFVQARLKARQKLKGVGWTLRRPLQQHVQPPVTMFSYISGFAPRRLQVQLAEELPKLDPEPTLIVVEAPMGEGKTEAGLHAAAWLESLLKHRGIYLALPTQATGNAMYKRFREFLHYAAAERGIVPDLQLLHGGQLLNEAYQATLHRTRNPAGDPEDQEEERWNIRAESWFSVRKRASLSEYGVGTIDQGLLGVLPVNHHFLRLFGLANRVVILDEVHAYTTYTSELIFTLVRWLRALGSSVILMSATLPNDKRRNLLAAWGAQDEPAEEVAAYPRFTLAQSGQAKSHHIDASREQTPITVRALAADAVAQKALSLAVNGGCVAVIVNTVQRAQEIFRQVRDLYQGNIKTPINKGHKDDLCVLLFHARYPAKARTQREVTLLKMLGPQPFASKEHRIPKGDYRPRRMILIATQVAEQSLDFDADVMITDLAPMDLILQRAGRLHRHRKTNQHRRHQHQTPELWIAGLDQWPQKTIQSYFWDYVYAPHLLLRTWLSLQEGQQIKLPGDLDTLVQKVYGPEAIEAPEASWKEALAAAYSAYNTKLKDDGAKGGRASIGNPDRFFETQVHLQAEPYEEAPQNDFSEADDPRTRDGTQSLRVVPVFKRGEHYWLDPEGTRPAFLGSKQQKLDTSQASIIYQQSLTVSSQLVVRQALKQGPARATWEKDHLIHDCIPLVFEDGRAVDIRGLRVELDEELGLVYRKAGAEGVPRGL